MPAAFTPQPASGIEISKAYAWAPGDANECVDFTNRSPKPITHVRFTFSHLARDHSLIGDEEPLDIHARRGPYESGVVEERNCRGFNGNVILPSMWSGGGTDGEVLFQGQSSTISVRVDQVDYTDGTSWRAKL